MNEMVYPSVSTLTYLNATGIFLQNDITGYRYKETLFDSLNVDAVFHIRSLYSANCVAETTVSY
jgi:hypothetical protein